MPAKEYLCTVVDTKRLTPTVVELRFEPSRKFKFDPGQFISIVVPPPPGARKPLRRAYSLVVPYEQGWGLCVKIVPGGPGSNYVASLKKGDTFKAFAPYGDFIYEPESSSREVCFVSTGTGVAPLLAMLLSQAYRDNPPSRATHIFGARTEDEIIYPGRFAELGLVEINAISKPNDPTLASVVGGFKGRVTDYLRSLPPDWAWDQTDFYLCGNGEMVAEVRKHLRGRGVPEARIRQEVYFVAPDRISRSQAAQPATPKVVVPPPFKKAG